MKKLITIFIFAVVTLLSNFTYGQNADIKNYETIKANFWKQYLQYKENLKINPYAVKPVDQYGIFEIDSDNRLVPKNELKNSQNQNTQNAPWVNGDPTGDLVSLDYTWAQTAGAYTPVAGTILGTNANDDNTFSGTPIGFNFIYEGVTYTTVDINTNGYIRFGAITGSHYPQVLSLQTNIFAGCNNDLRANNTTSTLQYVTTGSVGSRTMTIQWANYGFYNAGWDGSDISFQIILNETTNTIQVVYGAFPTIVLVPYTTQAGMNTTTADFNNRTTTTDWAATTAGASNIAGLTLTGVIKPASGLTYSWTPSNMIYSSSTTAQLLSGQNIIVPSTNNQVLQIQVVTVGSNSPLAATNFNLGTNGSTNPATDISNAKLYYTGTSNVFSAAVLFGSSASPNGTFNIAGSQSLPSGTSYFWLVYDVPATGVNADVVDAQCNSVTINAIPQVPAVIAPAGNRPLLVPSPLCGIKTIPGNYPTITAAISDLNLNGVGCNGVTFNVAANFRENNTGNLVISCLTSPPSSTRPIVFQKSGAGANPMITSGPGISTTLDGIIILNGVSYVTFDGIDLMDSTGNVTTTTQMEWGYAVLKQSGTIGSSNNVIKNCTVTLQKSNVNSVGIYTGNHTPLSTTALSVSALSGASSYNKYLSNTIQNCFIGMQIQGFSAASPYDLYDQGNEVGTIAGARSQILNFGNGTSATSAYGIRAINQNNIKIYNTYINSSGGADNNSTLNGIFLSTGTNSNFDIYNDTVTVVSGATTSQLVGITTDMGGTGNGNTINIYNNVVQNCLYPLSTSGEFRGIANNSSTATNSNIYNNKVINNTLPGTGQFAGLYLAASTATNMITENVYNNVIQGNTKTGTSGVMYMCYVNGSVQNKNFYNNQLLNNSNATSSGLTYGYYNNGVDYNESVHDNVIANNTGSTAANFYCINATSGSLTSKLIYNNTINSNTGGNQVGGIFHNLSNDCQIYNNNIYNLTSTNATGIAPAVFGIGTGTTGVNTLIYNNFISELKAPNATGITSVYGMWLLSAGTIGVYYNTIYLNASSTSSTFGSAGINYTNAAATIPLLDLRNNIIVNSSTPGLTGRTVGLMRSAASLVNYNSLSGNNCIYAGAPSATNLIYYDGTNSDQTLQAFKNRVGPREQASFSEIPPFVNIGASPYNLHIQTGVGTQIEKGGQPVSVTVDYDGTTRSATFPDVGADEIAGIMTDNASPNITYTLLGNSDASSPRVVNGFSITDPSGVNTTAGTKPRMYYKKSTNTNTFNDNTNATDGWKYVEATNAASPFSFSIDYTLVNGGVAAANIIQYFVTAQDLNGTPFVGINNGAFTLQPTSVNLAAANFPLNGTINSYTITTSAGISGTINVGSAETITSLTNTGGAFSVINSGTLSGNVILNITSDLNSELGTVALNQWSEIGAGSYTVTIVSSAATIRTIQGITNSNGMVRLDGADRVTIDGRFGGTGQYLRFRNFSLSGPAILLLNDAQSNTIRNCILEGNSTATSGNTSGVINIGTTTLANGNDNNTITFNEVRDRSDSTKYPVIGISCGGTSTVLSQYNNNCVISNNNVHDFYIDGGTIQGGIIISTGNTNFNIDSNSVYMVTPRSIITTGTTIQGIGISNSSNVAINGGFNIRNNYVGGSAPLCAGTPFTLSVASTTPIYGFRAIQIVTGQIPNSIQGNTIANYDLTVNGAASNFLFCGIAGGNGIHNVGTIAGNTVGSGTGNDNIKITINGATGATIIRGISLGFFTSTVWGGNVDNNTVGSFTIGGPITGTGTTCDFISIGASAGWQNDFSVSNNTVGSQTTPNSIRFTYTAASTNMRGISVFPVNSVNASVNNNKVMNITEQSSSAGSVFFSMLMNSGAAPLKYSITNNTIANLSSAMTSASTNALNGIYLITSYTNCFVGGNNVQNLALTNTAAASSGVIGMLTQTNNGMSGTILKNKVSGLTNQLTGAFPAIMGMWMLNGADWNISNNMFSLTNGETSLDLSKFDNKVPVENKDYTVKNVLPGFEVPFNYVPSKEKYEDIPSETPSMSEYMINSSSLKSNVPDKKNEKDSRIKNEKQEVDAFTIGMPIYGFYDQTTGGTKTMNYNTVYIGGSNTGTAFNSYCLYKVGTDNAALRNNLFFNGRTGTGLHFAIANDAVNPLTGWVSNASNYNVFVASDSTAIGSWGATNKSIDTWRSSSLGDNQSWFAKTNQVSAVSLFTNISTGDLHILSGNSAAWLISGKGIALTGYGDDYDGNTRQVTIAGGVTDIGADEFAATPPANPVALQSSAPGSGGTTDYTLYGRKICTINWGTGGTYPSSVNVNYFSGVSPLAPDVTTPNRTSNSYWTALPVGSLSGTTYDITWYYGDNETYTITSPATNVLLAKNDAGFWMTYPQGTGNLQSDLTPSLFSVKARGLFGFSSFSLSDAALPAEFPRTPLNNATGQPGSVTLVWSKSAIAVTYRIQLSTDSLFNTLIVNDSTVTDTTKPVSGLINNTNYWWRVNGKNGTGTGGWSQVFKFGVTTIVTPAPPVLSSPPNNSTNQPVALNLVWFKSTSAASYRVQLSTENTFTTGLIVNDSTLTDSIRTVSGLTNSTTYFWRVNAKNVAGTSLYSTVWQFTTAPLGPAVVNLTVIPGGFYNAGTGKLNMKDTIRVYLVDSVTCLKVDSAKGVLDSVNFTTNISFSNANTGNYYLLVYHRNHLGLATRFKATVTRGASVGYDFTTDSAKAFGFNMVKISNSPVRWAMIPGDANRDGFVDGLDQTIWLAQNGFDGYLASDFNGDNFVDGLDQTVWLTYNGNSSFLPCGFTMDPVTSQIIINTSDYDAKKSNRIRFDSKKHETPVDNNTKQNNNRK